MSEATLNSIIKRLEIATNRLEELAKNPKPFGGSSNDKDSKSNDDLPAVKAFDDILNGCVQKYMELSNAIGGLIKEQSEYFLQALQAQRQLIAIAINSKKPDATTFKELLAPTETAMNKICNIREQNRQSKLYNHLSTLSESILALGWVLVEPAPAPYIEENINAAQYYIIRVMKEFKEKEKMHVEWTTSYSTILNELKDYVKKYHTTGLTWNPNGGDVKDAKASGQSQPQAQAQPKPKPAAAAASSGKPDATKLFAELNRGENITTGLRKVDPSEKKIKPVSSVVKSNATATSKVDLPKKPAKQVLEGNKWTIENFVGNKNIIISDTEIRHLVYIYNCVDSTIQIQGKINAITLDNCKKTGVVIDSVVSAVDVVNSKSVQIQIKEKAPTISIDKTDGAQLFLSPECSKVVEIFSSKSSEMNVMLEQNDGDWTETPIPEQYRTKVVNGELVTTTVEHAG